MNSKKIIHNYTIIGLILIILIISFSSIAFSNALSLRKGEPIVQTDEPTGFWQSSITFDGEDNATLHGTLISNGGLITTCYFLWSTESGVYPNEISIGVIPDATSFSYELTGLTPGLVYYYKAKAENLDGTSYGLEKVFVTKPAISNPTKINFLDEKVIVDIVGNTLNDELAVLNLRNNEWNVPEDAVAALLLIEQDNVGRPDMDPWTLIGTREYQYGRWHRAMRNKDHSQFFFTYLSKDGLREFCVLNDASDNPCSALIYLYGWFEEVDKSDDSGTQWNYLQDEKKILTNETSQTWEVVESELSSDEGIDGLYITISTYSDQTIFFRKRGSNSNGIQILVESESYNQFIIPTDINGDFEYKTSDGSPINIWVSTSLEKCSANSGDRFLPISTIQWGSGSPIITDDNWHSFNITSDSLGNPGGGVLVNVPGYKMVTNMAMESPTHVHHAFFRKTGTSNEFLRQYAEGCGGLPFWTGVDNTNSLIDYKFVRELNQASTRLRIEGLIYPAGSVINLDTGERFQIIQDAIDDFDTKDGHTIYCEGGLYKEHLVINKSISLIGRQINTTIIDGYGTGTVVNINANFVTFKGFTIRNSERIKDTQDAAIKINSKYNIIYRNNIFNNKLYGMILESSNNQIYHNNFINNTINAYDISFNNWDDGYPSGGNYWDDYTGIDTDGDGIGDTPYLIPGGNNEDSYPIIASYGWNKPPTAPDIDGPVTGKVGVEYEFTFYSTDPENDLVSYFIDWGDESYSGWTAFIESGEPLTFKHIWTEIGNYTIRIKARDIIDAESMWGTLEVSMPLNELKIKTSTSIKKIENLSQIKNINNN